MKNVLNFLIVFISVTRKQPDRALNCVNIEIATILLYKCRCRPNRKKMNFCVIAKKDLSEILRAKLKFFSWRCAHREKFYEVVRESQTVENRCPIEQNNYYYHRLHIFVNFD